jgi:cytochrome c oxidase subunit 2
MIAFLAFQDPLGQLPPQASTFGPDVDGLFYFCTWVSLFFFFLLTGLLTYSSVKYRRKTEHQPPASTVTHNTTLEVVWTLIPTIILMVIFAWGFKGNLEQILAPGDSLQYRAVAKQWGWDFFHPGDPTASGDGDLWVPLNRPVKITMESQDVLHSLFVPAFRAKRDVVPGRYQALWFRTTQLGTFDLFCAEYCGKGHSEMSRKVHVVTDDEYAKKPWQKRPEDPIEWGKQLYTTKGCVACHAVAKGVESPVGPTFYGLFGREEEMEDGSRVTVDEAYIHESLREPQKRIVKGFATKGAMTVFGPDSLPDDAVSALIDYIKTLHD